MAALDAQQVDAPSPDGAPEDAPTPDSAPDDAPTRNSALDDAASSDTAQQLDQSVITCQDGLTACSGLCVNTLFHLQHCGGCDHSCGPTSGSHARCVDGNCDCYEPYLNCNNDWSDGCECGTECDSIYCRDWPCDPNGNDTCGTAQVHFCSSADNICKVCTLGWMNCDNRGTACDCKITSYSCFGDLCQ